jgi:UDP-N-acetylmuramoyl-L-alanyl-D-glutamate--2,6-diaminopimelate ligase
MADRRPVDLSQLIARLPGGALVAGDADRSITSIETDSRAVRPGALFVALRGAHADGHAFASQALAGGAAAVVVEEGAPALPRGATVVTVPDSRRALSALAAAFFGDPSGSLDVIGVTGTNGKTTTVQMTSAILEYAGKCCGTIGTVGAALGDRRWPLVHTTPLPPELHGLLAEMHDAGAAVVAMEVSSHALALGRVDDVRFRIAALTNVTRDHLDFHPTVHAYAAAKRRLFEMSGEAVLNVDDRYGARWARELGERGVVTTTYGERSGRLSPGRLLATPEGSRFVLDGQWFDVRIPGRFNVLNALAAIGIARALGVDDATIAGGLARLERVPGRMERLHDHGVEVIVDYAHTPDALEQALRALRETVSGDVVVVFGCGGDRDRGKRPQMGAVAARYANRVYVTNDNPRTEDPNAIVEQIVAGIAGCEYDVELDRRAAIERAVAQARPGDAVLVAGKGHETYQIVGRDAVEFDDAVVVRQALQLRAAVK